MPDMRLASISVSALNIPFRSSFRHASAERSLTQSIWVEARDAAGVTGFGEGCPREYVTGESLEGARTLVPEWVQDLRNTVHDPVSLRAWVDAHHDVIDRNPAAWAGVETALLDLLGRIRGTSVEAILGLPELSGTFRYTAVIGDSGPEAFAAQLQRYCTAGFTDFKIKLSGDAARDRAKVHALQAMGVAPTAVRADANNLWSDGDAAIAALETLDFPFHAVEEPLRVGDYAGMHRIATALDTRIILDESLLRADQLEQLGPLQPSSIANLRISKMGGVLRSLDLLSALRQRGIPVIVGAHVGETSVMSRAALTVAHSAGDLLLAQEGAFGTHLLARDVAEPPLMFGAGGELQVAAAGLGAAGWGLMIRKDASA